MPEVYFPYGRGRIGYNFPADRFLGQLVSRMQHYAPLAPGPALVKEALQTPIGSLPLAQLAKGKQNVVLLASDHTRPVPSRDIIPPMLAEIRKGNPQADITILVATGCHRGTTKAELEEKFGPAIVSPEKIVVHDCDTSPMIHCGQLPSGGELVLNKLAVEADLLVAEGFIEPHFFAGFSGGRKSVMPGVAARGTVLYNHNAAFIAHPAARTGVLAGNPLHRDMVFAARKAGLAFICNVVINEDKETVFAVAGDVEKAHEAGTNFLRQRCGVPAKPADIVVVSNGGYPLDQNIYQAVKGMTAAEATVKPGGVIVMLAQSEDGHGGDEFFATFAGEKDLNRMLQTFAETPKEKTRVDQWQSQILARVLQKATVLYLSDAPDETVRAMHMVPAASLPEALEAATELLGNPNATITAIPDGVAVLVEP